MAIAPIDLQTMYSQMDSVAQLASRQNVAALGTSMQQQKLVLQDAQKAQSVQEVAKEEQKALSVSKDGTGQQQEQEQNKKKQEQKQEQKNQNPALSIKHSWLGTHIDITG